MISPNERRRRKKKARLEVQLQQVRKMEAIGTLAGSIANNFNNILGIILANTELMILDVNPYDPSYKNLRVIREEVVRGSRLTRQLLGFARKG